MMAVDERSFRQIRTLSHSVALFPREWGQTREKVFKCIIVKILKIYILIF